MLVRAERTQSTKRLFFVAAGLAALGTGLLPVRLNIFVSIGTVDFLSFYGRPLGPLYPLVVYGAAFMWVVVLLGLGFAGRSGHRWAFLAGMTLYGVDMIALLVTFSTPFASGCGKTCRSARVWPSSPQLMFRSRSMHCRGRGRT
jgi:hypothetical protein